MLAMLLVNNPTGNTALGNTIVTMIAFVILLAIVKKFTWEPFMKMLETRRQMIDSDLSMAAAEKQAGIDSKKEAQEILNKARLEVNELILNAKKQSLQIQDSMIKEAKEEVAQLHLSAKQEIAQERTRILNEVKGELTDISIEIAEKILRREITNQDYHLLIEDFIQGMDDL